jgi:hypothetical protein
MINHLGNSIGLPHFDKNTIFSRPILVKKMSVSMNFRYDYYCFVQD